MPHIAIIFEGGQDSPKIVRWPLLPLSFTQAHLCDTPFCYISRDNCAIPHKQARKSLVTPSLQVLRDMESIAAGPLRVHMCFHNDTDMPLESLRSDAYETHTHTHTYILYIYIYIYMLLCSIMGCFFRPMRSRMLPVMRSKMGCAASAGGKSLFLQCFVGFGRAAVSAAGLSKCNVVTGQHAENEASSKKKSGLWHFHLHPRFRRVWGLHLSVAGGHAQNCGGNGFFTLAVPKIRWKGPKPGTWKTGKKYLCWRAPPHFVRFGGAPGFRQKRVFENRAIFAEATENVVPNGRGSKTHFCTVGFEIGHLRSASNIVPKYFSLNWHFLSHSPSRRQAELFYFSCLFPFLSAGPFLYFHGCIFSATTSAICPFCCVSFLLFLLVVFVFLLVSLLLILLHHSFLSLDFCLLVFCPAFFLPFCVPCFFFLLLVLSSSCFLSFSYVSFCDSPLSCSHVSSRLIFFALCFFYPCSSSFSSFVFSSPQAPACAWEGQPWIEQLSHFVCLSGIFAKMSFAQIYCVFTFWWISFVHRTCIC